MGRHGYNRDEYDKVRHILIDEGMSVAELVERMAQSGVMGAGRIGKAAKLLLKMCSDKECKIFLGVAGAMVPGGMKEILIDMIEGGYVDVVVTTGANLTHDLAEALGYNHFIGDAQRDDAELNSEKIDRIYESYMPNEVYEGMEDFFKKVFEEISTEEGLNIRKFLQRVGKSVEKRSILKACVDNDVPLFCPSLADSGIGLMIWGHLAAGKKLAIDGFSDMKDIMDIAWDTKKPGVVYVGGGVPKNFIQQSMQLSPNSAAYGIQITMDRPEPGGSSGAPLAEGISWGKMNKKGEFVDVICDATIALPLIFGAAKGNISKGKEK